MLHPIATPVNLLTVDAASEGQRLDNFLLKVCKGVPKTHVYRIIRSGEVRVNKGRAQVDTRLTLGDVVRLPPIRLSERASVENAKQKSTAHTPPREFPILFEDDYLLVIDKPAGVAVHGGSGLSFGVIEQLRRARPEAPFLELVHRLDRETSGILLIAKRRRALVNLQAQFKARETGKIYLALVLGAWAENAKVIDLPLHKYLVSESSSKEEGERRVKVVSKDDPNGLRSITLVKLVKRLQIDSATQASLLKVTIKTGRTHQIRVHLAHHGCPILGDEKYGNFDENKRLMKTGFKRMYLHAAQLEFLHPQTATAMRMVSPAAFEPLTSNAVNA